METITHDYRLRWTAPDGARHTQTWTGPIGAALDAYEDLVLRRREMIRLDVDGTCYLHYDAQPYIVTGWRTGVGAVQVELVSAPSDVVDDAVAAYFEPHEIDRAIAIQGWAV